MAKKSLHETARKLRRESTEAETLLWRYLKDSRVERCKFRRQHPIGKYIADFASIEKKLIIELDGAQHSMEDSKAADQERSRFLETQGYKVIRFWNLDVLTNLEGVVQRIRMKILSDK